MDVLLRMESSNGHFQIVELLLLVMKCCVCVLCFYWKMGFTKLLFYFVTGTVSMKNSAERANCVCRAFVEFQSERLIWFEREELKAEMFHITIQDWFETWSVFWTAHPKAGWDTFLAFFVSCLVFSEQNRWTLWKVENWSKICFFAIGNRLLKANQHSKVSLLAKGPNFASFSCFSTFLVFLQKNWVDFNN